jgi:WXG100 family type VII secretion target
MANGGGGGFDVDLDKLLKTSQYVQTLVPQIQRELTNLDGTMQQLRATWAGNKAGKFQQAYLTWQQNHKQMQQALDNIGQQLQKTHGAYSTADET